VIGVKVSGDAEIAESIKALGDRAGAAMHNAADAGAEIVRDDASKRAPRSGRNKEHLADNIKTRKASMKKDGSVTAKVYVQRAFGYANPLEYGHIVRTNKGYKHVAARPFMEPARDANKEAVKEKIAEVLRGELFK
jgi:HK97 gp10 family phage protein